MYCMHLAQCVRMQKGYDHTYMHGIVNRSIHCAWWGLLAYCAHASVNTAPLLRQAPSEVSPFSSLKHTWFASLLSCPSTLHLLLVAVQWYTVEITHRKALYTHKHSCRPYIPNTNRYKRETHVQYKWSRGISAGCCMYGKGTHIPARNWLKLLPTFRPECYGLLQGKGVSVRLKTRAFRLKRWQDFQPITCTIDFNVGLCSIKYGQIL